MVIIKAFNSNSGFLKKNQFQKTTSWLYFYICCIHRIHLSGSMKPRYDHCCITSQSLSPCLLLTILALILWKSLSNPNVTKGQIRTFTDEAKPQIRLRTTADCQGGEKDGDRGKKPNSNGFHNFHNFHNLPPM